MGERKLQRLPWEEERYVRFYTRDTVPWIRLSFLAQALYGLVLRKMDRAGHLNLGGEGLRGVATTLRPWDSTAWEQIREPLSELLASGWLIHRDGDDRLEDPEYLDREEAAASASARKRAQRERDRARPQKSVVTGVRKMKSKLALAARLSRDSERVTKGHACLPAKDLDHERDLDSGDTSAPAAPPGEQPAPRGGQAAPPVLRERDLPGWEPSQEPLPDLLLPPPGPPQPPSDPAPSPDVAHPQAVDGRDHRQALILPPPFIPPAPLAHPERPTGAASPSERSPDSFRLAGQGAKAERPKRDWLRWRRLRTQLETLFTEVRQEPYLWRGADGPALDRLMTACSDDTEVELRWGCSLSYERDAWPGCNTVSQLSCRWNDLARHAAEVRGRREVMPGEVSPLELAAGLPTPECHAAAALWLPVLEGLRATHAYAATWLERLRPVALREERMVLLCPDRFFRDWVDDHYRELLEDLLPGGVAWQVAPDGGAP